MEPLNAKSSLLQQEHLRRNRRLIIIFFSLIIALALIIGGIIISLVHRYNLESQSPHPSSAINGFCSVTESEFYCITSLTHAIKTNQYTEPNQVFILTLQLAVEKLFNVMSFTSGSDSNDAEMQAAIKNCSSSLRDAMSQLNRTLVMMRVNQDVEMLTDEQRRDAMAWIVSAMKDLSSCSNDLGKIVRVSAGLDEVGRSSDLEEVGAQAAVDEARSKVYEIKRLVRNGKDFLVNCEIANANFRFELTNSYDDRPRNGIIEYLSEVSLFGSQYFVLIFLFCLLLRIY